jgi:hypothetical protein
MGVYADTRAKAGTGHDYRACADPDCPRYACRVYAEGVAAGRAAGHAAGYAAGYAAGAAARRQRR